MDFRPTRIPGLAALVCTCTLAAPLPALAAQGAGGAQAGEAPPPKGAAPAQGAPGTSGPAGPAGPLPEPVVPGAATCRTQCLALDAARPGSTVRVTGDGVARVVGVLLLGGAGKGDDVGAQTTPAGPGAVEAVVPAAAVTGAVVLVSSDGSRSKATAKPLRIGEAGSSDLQAAVASRKVFFGGRRTATLDVFVPAGAPRDLGVDVVRLADGVPVAHLDTGAIAPESVGSLEWRGVAGGRVQRDGRYAFRVPEAGPASDAPFTFLRQQFPIRGKHSYAASAAGHFGAGRGGGSHQGEDVFAACGTPLVAARGGTVKYAGFQGRAGNYLVIDGAGTGTDHTYMHLQSPAPFEKGDAVATGQPIGAVGDTGAAKGCHLHFEAWTAPGWYTGGRPVDPLPLLQEWDTQSGVHTPAAAKRAVAARARAARARRASAASAP